MSEILLEKLKAEMKINPEKVVLGEVPSVLYMLNFLMKPARY